MLFKYVAGAFLILSIVLALSLYKEKASHAKYREAVATHLVEAYKETREVERSLQAEADRIGRELEEKRREERELEAGIIADLRSSNIRLRNHWQGCEATSRVSSDSITASLVDADTRAREESAARIVRHGRRGDNWIENLQQYINDVCLR